MALPDPATTCEAWPVEWCGDVSGVEASITASAHEAASRIIWSLTGRRYGSCSVVRGPAPGDTATSCGLPPSRYEPRPDGPAIWLDGENPVVEAVFLDETEMDPADWAQAGKWLIRLTGGTWPPNTWTNPTALMIQMTVGFPPPVGAAQAVGELGYELIKACTGDECSLPRRVQTLTRQGVSMQMIDSLDFLDRGRIGLPICDQFIASVNPKGLAQASRVLSPDRPPWRAA